MQIWTEDSGAGYIYWKHINKYVFNNRFKVIACKGNRDILFKLERESSRELIVLIVDKMLDNEYTAETYYKIVKEIEKRENILMPEYGCTERAFLTYRNIGKVVGNRNKNAMDARNTVLANSSRLGTINLISGSSKTSEAVYKSILASLTNGTNAYINGNHIGNCWLFDCCNYNKRTCIEVYDTVSNKTDDVIENSEYKITVWNINAQISEYILNKYKPNRADIRYKRDALKLCNGQSIDVADMVCKYIMETGADYWNYERLYRRYWK